MLNVKQVYSRDVWSVYLGMVKGQECAVLLGVFFVGIETGLLCHEGRISSLAVD